MFIDVHHKKGPFHRKTVTVVLILSLLILCQCAHSNTTASNLFLYGLHLKGFEQKGPMLVYNRQNIFEYINGEAENYLPRGFNLLYVGNFLSQGKDSEMVMEVYDMGSKKGATSIFRVYARPPGEGLKGIAEGGWKSKSRCVFHRGSYFIRVAADPAADSDFLPSSEDIEALAREADRVLGK